MLRTSEAIVLRTYPVHEADLLITLFTRAEGKIKGVAKSAMKSRRRFGGALEAMTLIRAHYDQRERRELARFDSFDILASPLSCAVDYERACALSFMAEALDQLLADYDPHDDVFRLTSATLAQLEYGSIWMPLTYFSLWLTRLSGFLPNLEECTLCGDPLDSVKGDSVDEEERPAYFHALADGLMCPLHKRLASSQLSASSRRLARQIFRSPIEHFDRIEWPRALGADLRKLCLQVIERTIERKLVTAVALAKLA
ncbi:MAG: DNA repair protein RecO [Acidobacteriaceae bacterium]